MKKTAAVLLILLMTGISTGTVFAYLTSQDNVMNQITVANTDIRITEKFDPPAEWNPGTVIPKTVAVTSSTENPARLDQGQRRILLLDKESKATGDNRKSVYSDKNPKRCGKGRPGEF